MKIAAVVAVTVLCLLSGGPVVGQSSTKETAVEKQITETLHQMYEAEKRKDLKFVLSHLAEILPKWPVPEACTIARILKQAGPTLCCATTNCRTARSS